jgi:hypothetical protein
MQNYTRSMRTGRPKTYSQELLNNLLRHPFTTIEFVVEELAVSVGQQRPTLKLL